MERKERCLNIDSYNKQYFEEKIALFFKKFNWLQIEMIGGVFSVQDNDNILYTTESESELMCYISRLNYRKTNDGYIYIKNIHGKDYVINKERLG